MVGKTHLQLGIASVTTAEIINHFSHFTNCSFLSPACVLGVVVGSLLPDIDNPNSIISGVFPITNHIISDILKLCHRGLCHSLVFSLFYWYAYTLVSGDFKMLFLGLCIGNTVHILTDCFVSKTQIFFPIYFRGISVLHFEGQPDKYKKMDRYFSRFASVILVLSIVALGVLYAGGKYYV